MFLCEVDWVVSWDAFAGVGRFCGASSALRAPSSQRRHDRSITRPAGTFFPKKA